jgi:hypothetical protein
MRLLFGLIGAPLTMAGALLVAAGTAGAATVTYPDGKDGKTERVTVNQEIKGPAKITSDNAKDTLDLRAGAVVRFLGTETDEKGNKVESFFLKGGACDASLGFFTRLATATFWAFPEKAGSRAIFYVEAFPAPQGGLPTSYARVAKGSSLLRLVLNAASYGNLEFNLIENQGVTVQKSGERDIRFSTDPHNEWQTGSVRLIYPLPTGLSIDLYIPKATSGAIRPKAGVAGKTDVESAQASWKSGKILISTAKAGVAKSADGIGPGVQATIDEASGTIETGFVKVEFATLKAAVSLTSEFASLAMSPLSRVK